jgi:hypothetical protein
LFDSENAQPILVSFGEDGYVDAPAVDRKSVFNVDIVGPVDACDLLTNFSIEAENIQSTLRRSGFVRSQDKTALRFRGMNPDGGIIRIFIDGIGCGDRAQV